VEPGALAQAITPEASAQVEVEWELAVVTARIKSLASDLESREVEPQLLRARLADHYRDLEIEPLPPGVFDRLVGELDALAWRRMALAIGVLDDPGIRSSLASLARKTSVGIQVRGFVALALGTDALSLSLIRQSDVRVEEFARQFASRLGVAWRGESAEESRNRLTQIDYNRLLAESEAARKTAEERMTLLREKQQEAMARRRLRGKH
jgi:hypothetical protein